MLWTMGMRRLYRAIAIAIALALLLFSRIYGTMVPGIDLDRLTDESELIVTGELVSLQNGPTVQLREGSLEFAARSVTGVVSIDQILKGEAPAREISVKFFVPEIFVGWRSVELRKYLVFFLKTESTEQFRFTSPYIRTAAAYRGGQFEGSTPIDRVVSAIYSAYSSAAARTDQKLELISLLSSSKSSASTNVLRSILSSDDLALRLTADGALLERNDISGMAEAVEALLRDSQVLPENVSHNLLYGIAEGVKDPKSIPHLEQLLRSNDLETRRAATSALMHTHSSEAIAPLEIALEDSDFVVRYYGVVGLAEITGQIDWRPNMDVFRADQERYLKHWRDWSKSPS
jgi:hypothetical protein